MDLKSNDLFWNQKPKTELQYEEFSQQLIQSQIFLQNTILICKKQIDSTKNLELYDANSNKIGDLQLFHESPTSLNITWLGIKKHDRGKGYAQAAMRMAEDYARKSGMKQLTLEVPGISPDARHIYEKQGFEVVGQISDEDDVWGGLTSMKKNL